MIYRLNPFNAYYEPGIDTIGEAAHRFCSIHAELTMRCLTSPVQDQHRKSKRQLDNTGGAPYMGAPPLLYGRWKMLFQDGATAICGLKVLAEWEHSNRAIRHR